MHISDQQYISWQKKLETNKWYREFWTFWSIYGVLFYFFAALWILNEDQGWKILGLGLFVGLFARYVVCEIIHGLHKKLHVYQRLHLKYTPKSWLFSLQDLRPDSFPSEHASIITAFSVAIFWFFPALGSMTFIIAVIISIARVVVGYHDPNDIVAGWIVGVFSSLGLLYLLAPRVFTH